MKRRLLIPALIILPATFAGAGVLYAEQKHDDETPVHSYDTGSHAPRVWAFCFGVNGVYQNGDTDQFHVIVDDPNCEEGGILRD